MALKEPKPIKDPPLDNFAQEEFQDNLLDKMNFRLTFLSVILPIVLIVGLVFSYFAMDYKIREKHNATLKNVAVISQDIEELKTFFSEQTSESKKSLMDRIAVFNRTLNRIRKDIKKQAATLQDLKKTKPDKKAVRGIVKKELSGIAKSLDAVRGNVKKRQKALKKLDKTLNLLKKRLKKQESAIRNLSKTKADMKSLDKHYKEQKQLNDKVQFLELELRLLKSRIRSTDTTASPPSEKGPASKKESFIEEDITQ